MISDPILHDIIKSELTYNAITIFDLCKKIPQIKESNLFKKGYWQFKEARQEQLNSRYRQADCVWFFDGKKNDNYYVVNEVKTGQYDIIDIYNKYRTGQSGQIWIWGWNQINSAKVLDKNHLRKIKVIDIEHIVPVIKEDIDEIIERLVL